MLEIAVALFNMKLFYIALVMIFVFMYIFAGVLFFTELFAKCGKYHSFIFIVCILLAEVYPLLTGRTK